MNKDDKVIYEIEAIRSRDIENGSYITATIKWLIENDLEITKRNIEKEIPSPIRKFIKEEAYNENLVRPRLNPNFRSKGDDIFTDLFL